MILLEEIKKLRELEQQAECGPWLVGVHPDQCDRCEDCDPDEPGLCDNPIKPNASDVIDSNVVLGLFTNQPRKDSQVDNCNFIAASRNLAPAMLEVLGGFRKGDAEILDRLIFEQIEMAKFAAGFGNIGAFESHIIDMLKRLQQMAAIMEKEEH